MGLNAIFAAWQKYRARRWPTIQANVVKTPLSTTRRWFLHVGGNADSDYCLEWSVGGVKYRRRLDNKAEVALDGFVLASLPPKLNSQAIRYNPDKPSKVFLPSDRNEWIFSAGASLIALMVALVI